MIALSPKDKEEFERFLRAIEEGAETHVIGADEVGAGAWAGAALVGAIAVPKRWSLPGLNDSKKVKKEGAKETLFYHLQRRPHAFAEASVEEINRDGLGAALQRCFLDAVSAVVAQVPNSIIVLDGNIVLAGVEHFNFGHADALVPAVMAASVLAKVVRDRQMVELAKQYPGWGLGDHKGYGTIEHEAKLRAKGMSPVHRAYTPMERILAGKRGPQRGPIVLGEDVEYD